MSSSDCPYWMKRERVLFPLIDLSAGAADNLFYVRRQKPFTIVSVFADVVEATATPGTPAQVTLHYTPAGGADTVIATLTLSGVHAAGSRVSSTLSTPILWAVGDGPIILNHSVQAAAGGGSDAGTAYVGFEFHETYDGTLSNTVP